jgi:hypothetical protein
LDTVFDRWQGTWSPSVVRHSLLLDPRQIVLYGHVFIKVFAEPVFVQVGLQTEDFLRDFLVLTLDSFQLHLPLVKVQALRFEFNVCDRVTLSKSMTMNRWVGDGFLTRRYFNKLLQKFLVVTLDRSLLDYVEDYGSEKLMKQATYLTTCTSESWLYS